MTLTMLVVGFCVIFIVIMMIAKSVGPNAKGLFGSGLSNSSTGGTSGFSSYSNPLLDFGNSAGRLDSGSNSYPSSGSNNVSETVNDGQSPYANRIHLSRGNSSYSAQPYEEYVSIRNSGDASINITGWTLVNGKGSRPMQNSGNSYFYPTPDTAIIGQGTEFLDPSGNFQVGAIVLKPRDEAFMITGGPFTQYPFSIYTSFRENICESYLESSYPFQPALSRSCPNVLNDESANTITYECEKYVSSINRCTNPEKRDAKRFEAQTSQCKNFIRSHMNYPACVANNRYSENFSLNRWRVFLGKKAEMWRSKDESITLYDSKGLIVDEISY